MDHNKGRFPEIVHIQTPLGMNRALDRLATQRHMTKSELIRRTLLREVVTAGLPLGQSEKVVANG
jgi:hypothetical protein